MSALRNFYHTLGLKLYPFRYWLMLLTFGSAVSSIVLIFVDAAISQRYLLPTMVTTLWFMFLVSLAYYADATIPVKPKGLLPTLFWSLRKAWTHFVALLFLATTLGLLYLSVTAVRLALTR